MFKVLGNILLVILIIVSLAEIFRVITLIIFRKKDKSGIIITIPMSGHEEKAEFLIRSAIAKIKWLDCASTQKIICIDKGMDQQTRRICEIFKKKYEFIEICFDYELKRFLM